jgi:hypothetical protein
MSLQPEPEKSSTHLPIPHLKIHFRIIFPPIPESQMWSLSFRFYYQHFVRISVLSTACPIPSAYGMGQDTTVLTYHGQQMGASKV